MTRFDPVYGILCAFVKGKKYKFNLNLVGKLHRLLAALVWCGAWPLGYVKPCAFSCLKVICNEYFSDYLLRKLLNQVT